MWHFSLPHFQANSYSDTFELSFMYYSLPSKFFKCHPLVQHFGGPKSLLELTMEKKPFSPPLVGGDFHSVGNGMSSSQLTLSPSFFRGVGQLNHQAVQRGFCTRRRGSAETSNGNPHCTAQRCQIWSGCHLAMILKPLWIETTSRSSSIQWSSILALFFVCLLDIHLRNGKYL